MDSNLVRRIAVAAVGIPLALGFAWYGGWPLAVLVAVIAALGVRELYDIAAHSQVRAMRLMGIATAAAIPLLFHAVRSGSMVGSRIDSWWEYGAAVWLITLLGIVLYRRAPGDRPLHAAAVTLFGVMYAAILPTFLLDIRHGLWPERTWAGAALMFFPLVVTWLCDTAAMFGGRIFGGPKLAPSVSPGKTRSGALAGVVGGMLVAPLFVMAVFPRVGISISLINACAMAGLLAIVGQAGDLVESLFKREAGVKDSSALIPGHGGVLDRFDSLYFVIPVAAVCYRLLSA